LARIVVTITLSKEMNNVTAVDIQELVDFIQNNVIKNLPKEIGINVSMSVQL
jgi:hypothetical protein